MRYLYLDESGDLGFDFVNKKPSKFFTIAVLVVEGAEYNRAIGKAVRMVLRRKLNPRSKRRRIVQELKGGSTSQNVKEYFYERIAHIPFQVYAMTLHKLQTYTALVEDKSFVYNLIAQRVIEAIPLEGEDRTSVVLTTDKNKRKGDIDEFNTLLYWQFQNHLSPRIRFDIFHEDSRAVPGLQAVDMFVWGIHRRYEMNDRVWYGMFNKKIALDEQLRMSRPG